MKRILYKGVMAMSLITVFLFNFLGGAMIIGFLVWLVRFNASYYLPEMHLVPEWVCFLGGATGMAFLLFFESDMRRGLRESLFRTADFISRLFSKKYKKWVVRGR